MMKTTKDLITPTDFINFFTPIPNEEWCCGSYGLNEIAHCAVGHLVTSVIDAWLSRPDNKLDEILCEYLGYNTIDINDGLCPRFQQDTPKARILAALTTANELMSKAS